MMQTDMQLNAVVSTQVRAFTFKLVYQNKIFSFFPRLHLRAGQTLCMQRWIPEMSVGS